MNIGEILSQAQIATGILAIAAVVLTSALIKTFKKAHKHR